MRALALEVNDVGLLALRAGASRPEPESPGLALFDGGRLVFGAEALARARTKPRDVHDAFWDPLDTAPARAPFPEPLTRADLAHGQLATIAQSAGRGVEEAYLVVPGFWSPEALGLLLGVARAAALPVVGLVDAAVAATSLGQPGEALIHVDLTRHRSCVTALVQGDEITRTRVVTSEGRGWKAFLEAAASALASQFVRETRFDPLHEAATEQALHDAVPGCLAELAQRPAAAAVLQSAGRAYRIEITRPALLAAVDGLYRGLAEQVSLLKTAGEPATLLLSARAARLPGLADRLREIRGLLIVELALDAPASGALRHRERLRHDGEALPFVMRLPSGLAEAERRAPAPASAPPAAARAARPTHVLHAAVAHALGDVPLLLGTAPPAGGRALRLEGETSGVSRHHCTLRTADGEAVVEDRSSFGTFLNGERVAGRAILRVGDRLRLGSPGLELLLIAVEA